MALTSRSLFTYGMEVTSNNRSIDFKGELGGDTLLATLSLGYYSLTDLLAEIKRALEEADLDNLYTVTADRTISSGTENRITIASDGTYFQLLFASGPRAASSSATLMGYTATDKTGSTSYQGASSAGTTLLTNRIIKNWVPPTLNKKKTGSLNVTASGRKEANIYSTQRFFQFELDWIPAASASVSDITDWANLMDWLTSQRSFDFTPQVSDPSTYYNATLESTPQDQNGMSYMFTEFKPGTMIYNTGLLKFRVRE